jgi:hypothetical protein
MVVPVGKLVGALGKGAEATEAVAAGAGAAVRTGAADAVGANAARAGTTVIPQSIGAAESAFSVASRGGRHSGFLRGAERMSRQQLQRAERSLQAQIELHEAKIANPAAYVSRWESLEAREQQGLIRHWGKEIGNFSEQQSIVQELLRR